MPHALSRHLSFSPACAAGAPALAPPVGGAEGNATDLGHLNYRCLRRVQTSPPAMPAE
jgi:hypothetical protein